YIVVVVYVCVLYITFLHIICLWNDFLFFFLYANLVNQVSFLAIFLNCESISLDLLSAYYK
ncbi:hypothetical protein ACJX0J_015285, partial [Zea mays]